MRYALSIIVWTQQVIAFLCTLHSLENISNVQIHRGNACLQNKEIVRFAHQASVHHNGAIARTSVLQCSGSTTELAMTVCAYHQPPLIIIEQ